MCVHGRRISHKPEIIMHNYATNSGCNVLDKLVRVCTCIGSTTLWTLKLFFSLIAVVCVNASVLWMLKYPNWQQRKSYRKNMYLLSLGEEMVWPRIWRKADSGKRQQTYCRALRAMDVPWKQPASHTNVKKDRDNGMEGVLSVQQLRTKEQTGSVASVQNGYARTTLSRQTIQNLTIARNNHNTNNFTHISVLNYIVHKIFFKYFIWYSSFRNEKLK